MGWSGVRSLRGVGQGLDVGVAKGHGDEKGNWLWLWFGVGRIEG